MKPSGISDEELVRAAVYLQGAVSIRRRRLRPDHIVIVSMRGATEPRIRKPAGRQQT